MTELTREAINELQLRYRKLRLSVVRGQVPVQEAKKILKAWYDHLKEMGKSE